MRIIFFIFLVFYSLTSLATLNNVDKAQIYPYQQMDNGGFENGRAGWTASGGSFIASNSSPLVGALSGSWNSDGASQTLSFKSITIPEGLKSANGVFLCKIQTPSGTATHNIQITNGSDVLASQAIASSTSAVWQILNFIFPSSGSVVPRLVSVASDEPTIKIDECWLGDASQVNVLITDGSTPWQSYTPTFQGFGTVSGVSMQWRKSGPNLELRGRFTSGTVSADEARMTLPPGLATAGTISTLEQVGVYSRGSTGDGYFVMLAEPSVSYLAFGVQFSSSASLVKRNGNAIQNNSTAMSIQASVPIAGWENAVPAFKADTLAMSWSGYHDNTCSWAISSTSYANPSGDASCALVQRTNMNFGTVTSALSSGNPLPGIVFTPKRAGTYYVCAHSGFTSNNINTAQRLWDGTTTIAESPGPGTNSTANNFFALCGLYEVSDTTPRTLTIQGQSNSGTITIQAVRANSAIEWSIFAIDQSLPAPVIKNSVVNPRDGVTNICSAFVTHGGTPTVVRSDGNCLGVSSDNGAGDTTFSFANGTFSDTPNCICSVYHTGQLQGCLIDSSTAISNTTVRIQTSNASGAGTDHDFFLMCIGPR